jgi:hypothetical protein
MTATAELPQVSLADIEVTAERLDVARAAAIYREHGALVVRGLMKRYIAAIGRDIETAARQALALLPQARQIPEGWVTPDGTLFLPAPKNFSRDKQIMVLGVGYQTSGAFFQSAFDPATLELLEAIIGPNIELFMNGQCLYKEPVGGHPKLMHQDSAYFEHRFEGPTAILSYVVDTTYQNGALHVVPGSHRLGQLRHVDTFSHLGLEEKEWPFSRGVCVNGQAGDAIFFHVRTVHGSPENHSTKPRPVFIHRYRRPDDFVVIGATSTDNRALAEKKAAEAKKDNQQGLMVRGFRAYLPDR